MHKLGYLPLEFCSLPEGTRVPLRVPACTVENTHDDFYWVTNYFETIMSATLWLGSTSATNAYRLRKMLNNMSDQSGGDMGFVGWQGHDFSMRGMGGLEAARLSGAGHLLSFTGSDTIPAIHFINRYYSGDNGLLAGSVAATEHAVQSSGGKESELETYSRLLDLYPKGIVSIVSDTWDLFNVITVILPQLKDKIMSRDGKLTIRPDSGDPVKIICGDPNAIPGSNEHKGVIQLLWEIFGGTINKKGFRELDSHISAIYGDAITYDRANEICSRLISANFASTNIVFGVGSFTYQLVSRDTYGFAMKATWAKINGEGINIFKSPKTDDGTKNSATGRLVVTHGPNGFELIEKAPEDMKSLLSPIWRNGQFLRTQSFAEVRATLWS